MSDEPVGIKAYKAATREQTAAFLLGTLITRRAAHFFDGEGKPILEEHEKELVKYVVAMADLLRAELDGVRP